MYMEAPRPFLFIRPGAYVRPERGG